MKPLGATRAAGFTLTELMIAVAILGTIVAIALPSFKQMIRNYEVRVTAESLVSGLQRARGEAVSRNTSATFTLGSGSSWTVTDAGGTTIASRATSESQDATVAKTPSTATSVAYNNLGQIVVSAATLSQMDVSASGASTTLRVLVVAGGGARMCDPSLPAYPTNFRGC